MTSRNQNALAQAAQAQAGERLPLPDGVRLMTEEDLNGFTLDQVKCRACSGYGNCGFKKMNILNGEVVSICQRMMAQLIEEREAAEAAQYD